jgi:hypothetical protein
MKTSLRRPYYLHTDEIALAFRDLSARGVMFGGGIKLGSLSAGELMWRVVGSGFGAWRGAEDFSGVGAAYGIRGL